MSGFQRRETHRREAVLQLRGHNHVPFLPTLTVEVFRDLVYGSEALVHHMVELLETKTGLSIPNLQCFGKQSTRSGCLTLSDRSAY